MFTITEGEWKTAEYYLKNKSDGTKLTYSAQIDSFYATVPRKSSYKMKSKLFYAIEKDRQDYPDLSQTFHSFIKIEGIIYAIAQGKNQEAVVGCGKFGKVKFIQDRMNNLAVLKLEWGETSEQYNESIILKDRQLSRGKHKILHSAYSQDDSSYATLGIKYATHMLYLGMTIDDVIVEACSDEKRIKMAIGLCLAVHDLHKIRTKSSTRTSYAHRDIKPPNVTWDEKKGEAHLIDFGFSHSYSQKPIHQDRGSDAYLPNPPQRKITGEQNDVFALRRTLYLPERGYCSRGYIDKFRDPEHEICPGILTLKLLKQLDVERFIDTASTEAEKNYFIEDNLSAGALAAILIAAQLKLTVSLDDLKNYKCKTLAIIALYGQSKETIENVLKDKRQTLTVAAFSEMGKFSEMEPFMQDEEFVLQMNHTVSLEEACVLIHLKSLDLAVYYKTISKPEITTALYSLTQQPSNLSNKKNTQSVIESPSLATAIRVLEKAKIQEYFFKLFNSPKLCDACVKINIQDRNTMTKAAHLFRKKLDEETLVNQLALLGKDKKKSQLASVSIFRFKGKPVRITVENCSEPGAIRHVIQSTNPSHR